MLIVSEMTFLKSTIIISFAVPKIKSHFMLKVFKNVAILEGISYLVLFFNMLYIKHSNIELYHSLLNPLGMTHGLLFIGYVLLAVWLKKIQEWNNQTLIIILGASLLPFATFYIEKKYLRKI